MNKWMRWLLGFVVATSVFAQDVIPAGTDRSYTTVYTYDWTSDGSGNATGRVAVEVPGIIQSIATMPGTGADQPTDNYDVVVEQAFTNTAGTTTSQNVDLLGGVGANRDDTNQELVDIWPSPITNIRGKLQIEVTNAGAANTGRVQVFVYRTLAINSSGGNFGVPLGGVTRQILQWISSSQAKWVTVSGDGSMADGGALTIANGAVTPAKTSITGTPNGLKYLRDDWTWQVPGGGGGVGNVSGPGLSTDNALVLWDGTDGDTVKNSDITYSGTAVTVPADILITGGNGLAHVAGTQEWYKSTGVSAGNLRYRWIFDTNTESSTYTGSILQLQIYDNTGDGSEHTAWTLARDPAAAWVFYHPITIDKLLTTKASATGGAGFNLPPGTAPTSPNNGDVWTTNLGLYARINGATVGPYVDAAGSGVTDHGALTGLSDDDHPQYPQIAGTESISGAWTWADDIYQRWGTGDDIRFGYDETTDDRGEWTNGTNLLGWQTDTGSWGRTGSSGILEARRSVTTISVSSITRSSQTATVTTASAHGLSTGDFANITGAVETQYNGAFRITRTGATTFTYTVDGSPTTPATGTILFKPLVQLFFNDDANSAPLNIICNGDVSYLNPGSTTAAHIITNREAGHLIFDLYGNDARDSISFRTNSSTGTIDAIDTILMTLNGNNRVGILQSNPAYVLDVNGTGRFAGAFQTDAATTIGDAVADTLHINPSSITLEGDAADANEITITTAALGADYTQTLPAKSGTFAMTSDISNATLYSNSTRVGNVLGGEDDLMSYTVPGGTLAADNSRLEVRGVFQVDTGGANTLKAYWNGVAVYDSGSVTPTATGIVVRMTIIRTGATSQDIHIEIVTGSTTHTARVVSTTGAATLSGGVVVKFTGTDAGGTSDDIAQDWGVVEYRTAA